jgi:hypothetical protein
MSLEDLMVAAMRSVIEPKTCIYLAGPITSGFHMAVSADESLDTESLNRAALAKGARRLRMTTGRLVIDPGHLIVGGWEWRQYGEFFLRVLDTFAAEVRFLPGWNYSFGATAEFVYASEIQLPCLDLEGDPLRCAQGRDMISRAAQELRSGGAFNAAMRLEGRVESLDTLVNIKRP